MQLDPSSEIISLNNVDFTDLTARIKYAYYLDGDAYARAKAAAGITEKDPRQLYATIDYSYAGYYLGSCNVFINPDAKVSKEAGADVVYINVWLLIAMAVAAIAIVIIIVHAIRKAVSKKNFTAKPDKRGRRSRVRYYDKSDSVDLREQYINSGSRDKGSIHKLRDIGVEQDYEDYYAEGQRRIRTADQSRGRTQEQSRSSNRSQSKSRSSKTAGGGNGRKSGNTNSSRNSRNRK